eukprot:07331.XXX_455943_456227_1 [CDS] Oithona nana genome sequencing.
MTLYLRASKISSIFFPVHFFLYHNGLICCQCWFRHEWEKKRRGKLLFFRVSILTSCLFNFHQVLQTVTIFCNLEKNFQINFYSVLFQINVHVIF